MPRKIRQLIADLEQAGFVNRGGKGSHRNFTHPKGLLVTISGQTGDDAKPYQEKLVRTKIQQSQP
jgi:predicted RNA binding protein YcfA (HicA-like mRNA interferase family)